MKFSCHLLPDVGKLFSNSKHSILSKYINELNILPITYFILSCFMIKLYLLRKKVTIV